ncbi:MAG: AAA family ATPase [Cryomorphaceae bacterium]|nr:AAA family ATPase [Cryomorphaceae bacterium]
MKYIHRAIESTIKKYLKPNKAVVLLGARRVGKTELVKHIISELDEKPMILNGEDEGTHLSLEPRTVVNYERLLGKTRLLVIDEAQAIPEIGLKLKLMLDSIEGLKVLVTGSSVFDLENQLGEPLVGRKMTLYLYPLAQQEFGKDENYIETKNKLEERLIFGSYPELEHLITWDEKAAYLKEQVNSYLLKDILEFEGVRKRDKIVSVLRMIAFRVGSEISVEGIANDLQMGKGTVDKYLDLLSKVFIIHKVSGFSRNLDNEITKMNKWYFYDNGIRNAMINNFNFMSVRDDQGKLWENYLISERLKHQEYTRLHAANFFWRTHTRQEIDWIEERGGRLYGYEFKWNSKKKSKVPASWAKAYPNASFEVINPDNYLDFIT